ncbi:hypothetical protein NEIMUCOT_04706 [Neisseria mucosa ATCC 25996]|uniref:Uncharacterized protein n=1 Tax=Neisseria mucosa (strain ATCC 25996 / DSM 4631 / NCTC 10774 / M26) TaxID=546266 RepID=D2ZVR3_NEIM2|nr:hypothetical protein NEIMUCOT_04706 [Neisseria mucosa ATCC 25996]SUA36992.1 Uncharacterised protein [Neisseria mucosa]
MFQHTAARRRLGLRFVRIVDVVFVSTHSRPKAAGPPRFETGCKGWFQHTAARRRLGEHDCARQTIQRRFNTQPPEGGWAHVLHIVPIGWVCFNTQPPEGGWARSIVARSSDFGFNTQPPEGGWILIKIFKKVIMCFNTQPPEGGWAWEKLDKHKLDMVSTHSRPKAAGPASAYSPNRHCGFQHTAARRRLGGYGFRLTTFYGFNTQPPEGGWF